MMKRTIIAPGLFKGFGGPLKTIGQFAEALDTEVQCFCDVKRLQDEPLAVNRAVAIESSRFPILRQFLFPSKSALSRIETAINESSIVSCHMFYRYYALCVYRICHKSGVPYWFVPHGILDPWVMNKGRMVKELYLRFGGRSFIANASTVICATRAEAEKAQANFELPSVDILPWPVELVDLKDRDDVRERVRGQLGISEESRVLLYFGRLHQMKRPLETIEALARTRMKEIHLIIVGNEDGITLNQCRNFARIQGIEENVHVVGPVYGSSKYDYMFASDAYISLSHRENFNHTAAESLAARLPVILSPGNDLISEMEDVDCYWKMESNDIEPAAASIRGFANTSDNVLEEMGQAGRDWVKSALNFELFASKLSGLVSKYGC